MNNLIREEYLRLPVVTRQQLQREFSDSPKMLRLLRLLEQSADKKFGVHEAVSYVYEDEEKKESFEVLRNRFFKLRKKLAEALERKGSGTEEGEVSGINLLPLEQEYYRCRALIQNNHYQEARRRLEKLASECWRMNIFELLPDTINQLIYCNFALNVFRDNKSLYKQFEDASALLAALNEQRLCARKAYEQVATHGYIRARPFVGRMKVIAQQHKNYPRFEMYYQFSAFTLGTGTYGNDVRVLARHYNRIRELIQRHPDIPPAFYEQHAAEMIQYYLHTAQGFYAFQRGDVEECYRCFMESWNIAEATPGFRIKKSDSQYSNRITIEIATGRFSEALATAEELLEFLKDQKEEERRLKAYAEMVQVYTYAYPKLKPASPEFLLRKMDEYLKVLKSDKDPMYGRQLGMKAVLLLHLGEIKQAVKIGLQPEAIAGFEAQRVPVYTEIFRMAGRHHTPAELQALRKKIEVDYGKSKDAGTTYTLKRALVLVDQLAKNK